MPRPRRNEVLLTVREEVLRNEDGRPQSGIVVSCPKCGHQVTCYGTGPASERRACSVMREECPRDESNWYVKDEEG